MESITRATLASASDASAPAKASKLLRASLLFASWLVEDRAEELAKGFGTRHFPA
jgi:hypothetical protein